LTRHLKRGTSFLYFKRSILLALHHNAAGNAVRVASLWRKFLRETVPQKLDLHGLLGQILQRQRV
jgi:hypothetical protein